MLPLAIASYVYMLLCYCLTFWLCVLCACALKQQLYLELHVCCSSVTAASCALCLVILIVSHACVYGLPLTLFDLIS